METTIAQLKIAKIKRSYHIVNGSFSICKFPSLAKPEAFLKDESKHWFLRQWANSATCSIANTPAVIIEV